jgi:4-hydroxybenzoate polyprenyltransferase
MPGAPLPVWTASFARSYLVTMRPYLLFVSGAAALAGLSFCADQSPRRTLAAFAALFLSYGLGQALTDCFQTDTDSLSAPYRPLVAGAVSRRQVLAVSMTGLVLVVAVLALLDPRILVPGAAAVAGLLTYTFFKRRWWGGPPWNSWIVALIPLMGRLTDSAWSPAAFAGAPGTEGAALGLAVLAVFFGYANFVVMGYFKDISADRATGYRTLPVVFGWRAAAVCGDVLAVLAVAPAAAAVAMAAPGASSPLAPDGVSVPALVALAAAVAVYVVAQAAMHRTRDERATGTPIANGVRALVLLCLAVGLSNRPGWWGALAVFYAFFELALRLRPERGQV